MKSQKSRHSGRRSGRGSRRSNRTETRPAQSRPVKLTLWEKIKAFFTPKPKKPSTPESSTARSDSRPRSQSKPGKNGAERKIEQVEVTSPKLFVGNLSFAATETDLSELFNGVGSVRNAEVVTHK